MKTVLIIGNGFDLDLGLKTSYTDFFNSEQFPSSLASNEIIDQILNNFSLKKWIDLEVELKKYATKRTGTLLDNETDKKIYKEYILLNSKLQKYLNELNYEDINMSSYASLLVKILNRLDVEIYNFNYTFPLKNILFENSNIKWVHGNINDKNTILGFQDDVDIDEKFCYMIKSHNPYYRSSNIRYALQEAKRIIFFGHSLGETDYHYFEDFFRTQSGISSTSKLEKKEIRIFTYNNNSRYEILNQLRNMNQRKINVLYDLNNFQIFCTREGKDEQEIKNYLEKLEEKADTHEYIKFFGKRNS